jgi:secondary thiamine-phosphate synthase enzyme
MFNERKRILPQFTVLDIKSHKRVQFIDITAGIRDCAAVSGIREGMAVVFVPHTTAGITINENADPSVPRDMMAGLERLVPEAGDYLHAEGNSDAHIKASLMGSSLNLVIKGGQVLLGTWQGVFFCEFDGPRSRKVWVSVLGV